CASRCPNSTENSPKPAPCRLSLLQRIQYSPRRSIRECPAQAVPTVTRFRCRPYCRNRLVDDQFLKLTTPPAGFPAAGVFLPFKGRSGSITTRLNSNQKENGCRQKIER